MICTHCKSKIESGKPMVSVGYAGAPTHAHYHTNPCFREHVQQQTQAKADRVARQLHADVETVVGEQ